MTEEMLEGYVQRGALPPKAVAGWRPAAGEASPLPRGDEVVSFLDFHMRVWGSQRTDSSPASSTPSPSSSSI